MKLINYCYVLELEKEKIYVGYSTALNQRLRNHFFPKEEDKRPAWILKYKPLALIYVISGGNYPIRKHAYFSLYESTRLGKRKRRSMVYTKYEFPSSTAPALLSYCS